MWTLSPRDAEDGLAGARQGSHSWRDDADSLTSATGVWGCPTGACVKAVTLGRCKEQGAAVPGCEMGCEKQEVKGSLSSRGFGRGLCSCPDPGSR